MTLLFSPFLHVILNSKTRFGQSTQDKMQSEFRSHFTYLFYDIYLHGMLTLSQAAEVENEVSRPEIFHVCSC